MFGPLGFPELLFILVLALLVFGPRKLPEVGRTLGKGLAEFRKASNELKRSINVEMLQEELRESDPRKVLRDADPRRGVVRRGADAVKAAEEASAKAELEKAEPGKAEPAKADPATPAASPRPVAVAEAVPRSTSGDDAEPEAVVP